MMETSSSNEANGYYPITIIKNNSNLQLSLPTPQSQKSSSIKTSN